MIRKLVGALVAGMAIGCVQTSPGGTGAGGGSPAGTGAGSGSPAGTDAGSGSPAGTDAGDGSSAGAGASSGSSSPATCPATCQTPAGTVEQLSTTQQAYQALEGDWRLCNGFNNMPPDAIGVEYGPGSDALNPATGALVGGKMWFLVQGPTGPVRGTGPAYELTYTVGPAGAWFEITMRLQNGGGFGGGFETSPCPRELLLDDGSLLVPFD